MNDVTKQIENSKQKLWRYMSISKFLSMIRESNLYFSRADKLGDPFEGSVGVQNYDMIRNLAHRNMRPMKPSELGYQERYQAIYESIKQKNIDDIKMFYVNCWHANEDESVAMWAIYGKIDEAICAQTSYGRLKNQLPKDTILGKVEYIDFRVGMTHGDPKLRIFQKRRSFSYENEIRAVLSDGPGAQAEKSAVDFLGEGAKIKINVNDLFEKFYISPSAPPWLSQNLIKDVLTKYSVNVSVKKSSIADQALF